jgi:rhodanese-related sulfurtransferase
MKTRIAVYVAVLLLFPVFFNSCATQSNEGRGRAIEVVKLAPKDAFAFIESNRNNSNFVLIDIRTPAEYWDGHIPTAINMNLHSESFEADINKLDRGKTHMIYCRTGRRVAAAVGIMEKAGFAKTYGIAGDILKWRSEGLPLVR